MKLGPLTLTFTESESAQLIALVMLASAIKEDPWSAISREETATVCAVGSAIRRAMRNPVASVNEAGRKGGKAKSPKKTDANRENARQPRPNRRKSTT